MTETAVSAAACNNTNHYSALVVVHSIVMSVSVFLSVCLSVCLPVLMHIKETISPNFTKFYLHVAYGCGSVLLWWNHNRLQAGCPPSFVDDIMFCYHGP